MGERRRGSKNNLSHPKAARGVSEIFGAEEGTIAIGAKSLDMNRLHNL